MKVSQVGDVAASSGWPTVKNHRKRANKIPLKLTTTGACLTSFIEPSIPTQIVAILSFLRNNFTDSLYMFINTALGGNPELGKQLYLRKRLPGNKNFRSKSGNTRKQGGRLWLIPVKAVVQKRMIQVISAIQLLKYLPVHTVEQLMSGQPMCVNRNLLP